MVPALCVEQNDTLLCPIVVRSPDMLIQNQYSNGTKGSGAAISVVSLQISAELSHGRKSQTVKLARRDVSCVLTVMCNVQTWLMTPTCRCLYSFLKDGLILAVDVDLFPPLYFCRGRDT